MRMVKDAKRAWRWHSMQALAALAVVPIVWMELPEDLKAYIPDEWRPWIMAAVAVGGIVGRLRAQSDEA